MPNHVTNEIHVIGGTNKQRLSFIKKVTNKYGWFDFNKIRQRPKSMDIEENGAVRRMSAVLAGESVYGLGFDELKTPEQVELFLREHGNTCKEIQRIKELAQIRLENYRRYGCYSWYDWSNAHWGTKWNAYDVEMPVKFVKPRIKLGHKRRPTHVRAYNKRIFKKRLARHAESGGELIIRFNTAWNMPKPIYLELANLFPHLSFEVYYADEDLGSNCGRVFLNAGKWIAAYIAPSYHDQSPNQRLYWRRYAFELCHPDTTPQDYGMDENYNYLDD